jgi:hypothetical protein
MVRGLAGHIERLSSGSWRVKVYAGTDPLTGRDIRFRKTCKTERAAQIELGKLLEHATAGRQPDSDVTVARLLDQYVSTAEWDCPPGKSARTASTRDLAGEATAELQRRGQQPSAGRATGPRNLADWWQEFQADADAVNRAIEREHQAAVDDGRPWPPGTEAGSQI